MTDDLDALDRNGAHLFLTVIACGLSRFAARGRAEKWIARAYDRVTQLRMKEKIKWNDSNTTQSANW